MRLDLQPALDAGALEGLVDAAADLVVGAERDEALIPQIEKLLMDLPEIQDIDAHRIVTRRMDGRMNDESRRIDRMRRVVDDVSLDVDLHEIGSRHLRK